MCAAVPGEVGGRLKAHLEAATAGDRQMMLKQIEALKAARQEAEHLRQEVHRLTNELAAQVGRGWVDAWQNSSTGKCTGMLCRAQ
jgi:hypothetical protein